MLFNSFAFVVFFPVVVLLYYIMPKRLKRLWLLAASYYFYMGWNVKYAVLILISTVVTYLCALLMNQKEGGIHQKKRLLLVVSLVVNFGILIFYKYFDFIYDIVAAGASLFGGKLDTPRFDILLPVGISFYTFQTLGYVIDVYRGNVKAEKNFVAYALFVSFFPQLVAGPIERSENLLVQIEKLPNEKLWDFDKATRGLLLMLWGFFMKMVIADRAAMLVDTVFEMYYMQGGVALLFGCVLFSIQLYCDFAGYSLIAVGAAKVLGIELMANFKAPFFTTSIRELWRRWHVSLSSWFRDYLYVPLGGNRCAKPRAYFNNIVTFMASGLWHGASWHFVVWGLVQGIYIVIGDVLKPIKDKFNSTFWVRTGSFGYRFFQGLCTFLLFSFSMVFFRADTVRDALYYLRRMFTEFDVWSLFDKSIYYLGLDEKELGVLWLGIFMLIIVDAFYARKKAFFDTLVKEQCLAVQYVIVVALLVMVIVFGVYGEGYDATQFIYFQF